MTLLLFLFAIFVAFLHFMKPQPVSRGRSGPIVSGRGDYQSHLDFLRAYGFVGEDEQRWPFDECRCGVAECGGWIETKTGEHPKVMKWTEMEEWLGRK